uniref:Phage protein n=1 Tax=Enterococcus phage PMBT56 TaxID=3229530 RepID=A0AB39C698_9CAUD
MKLIDGEALLTTMKNKLEYPEDDYDEGYQDAVETCMDEIKAALSVAKEEAAPEPIKLAIDGNIVAESFTGSSVTPINTLPHNYTKDVLEALLEASEDFYDTSSIQALLKGAIQAIPKGNGVIL